MTENKAWAKARFAIIADDGSEKIITVAGRNRWALESLIAAGARGCTPICTPGPRWSGYTHWLRGMGLAIETIHEPHGGPFKGNHARCVLRSRVRPVGLVPA